MLAGVVQSKRARKERPSSGGTRINLRDLHNLGLNNGRVFLARRERPAVNTAVYLLLDQSGSMGHQKIKTAFVATMALAKGLRSIPGTAVAAGTFSSIHLDGKERPYVASLLEFGESERRMSLAVPPATNNTPLAEALYCVAAKLLRRPEPRKLLVAMTDGRPDDVFKAQEVISKCRSAGLEAYGVGIMENGVNSLFGHGCSIVVNAISELPDRLFRLLAKRL